MASVPMDQAKVTMADAMKRADRAGKAMGKGGDMEAAMMTEADVKDMATMAGSDMGMRAKVRAMAKKKGFEGALPKGWAEPVGGKK